jgi:hypothetical protein
LVESCEQSSTAQVVVVHISEVSQHRQMMQMMICIERHVPFLVVLLLLG